MPKTSSSSVAVKSLPRDEIARRVRIYAEALRRAHPEIERIVWFGSWANGVPVPGSDVDLCIVLTHSNKRLRDRIPDYLPGAFPLGLDIFPYTRSELERLGRESPQWHRCLTSGIPL